MSAEGTDLGVSFPPKPPSLGQCLQEGGQRPDTTCLGLWAWIFCCVLLFSFLTRETVHRLWLGVVCSSVSANHTQKTLVSCCKDIAELQPQWTKKTDSCLHLSCLICKIWGGWGEWEGFF